MARIFATAASQAADHTDRHIVIARDLTAQPYARHAAGRQHVPLSDSDLIRFAIDEFDATGCAARLPTARMQLIDTRVLFQRQDQPLPFSIGPLLQLSVSASWQLSRNEVRPAEPLQQSHFRLHSAVNCGVSISKSS